MRTLLLNASYEPLCVVPWKRAIVLVMDGKAEVVKNSDREISSAHDTVPMPSVIRLTRYVQVPYRARLSCTRRGILARDKHVCQFTHCDRRADTIDHVMPRSKGGAHSWENVVAACRKCNFKKADKTMEQMGWKLKSKPVQPKGQFLLLGMKPRSEWEEYLEPQLATA